MRSPAPVLNPEDCTGSAAQPIVELEDATVRFQGTTVLRHVGFRLARGEVTALTGANGSGKSTLLRVLAGLLPVSEGRIVRHVGQGRAAPFARVALVAHEVALSDALTLHENLTLIARLLGRSGPAVDRSLERVGLAAAADRPVRACSQGMVRRAELARVLLTDPELLLLDEAHAALDVGARSLVVDVARFVTERGGCAVVVTHELTDLSAWSDRILRVVDGHVEDAG